MCKPPHCGATPSVSKTVLQTRLINYTPLRQHPLQLDTVPHQTAKTMKEWFRNITKRPVCCFLKKNLSIRIHWIFAQRPHFATLRTDWMCCHHRTPSKCLAHPQWVRAAWESPQCLQIVWQHYQNRIMPKLTIELKQCTQTMRTHL